MPFIAFTEKVGGSTAVPEPDLKMATASAGDRSATSPKGPCTQIVTK